MSNANWLTPNYRSRLANKAVYMSALATIIGSHAIALAANRHKDVQLANVNLEHVAPLIDQAANAATLLINDNAAIVKSMSEEEAKYMRSDALCRTYTRAFDLAEQGCIDPVGARVADEILERARRNVVWPEPASTAGLAQLDMFLVEMANAIKPLLATQQDLLAA